jgi:hypothetical protein
MKAVFISYNQAYHEEILEIINKSGVRGYSYWEETRGKGSNGGEPHLGDHAWPTLNASMLTIVNDDVVPVFLGHLRELDSVAPAMGLRAFTWNIEETI